MKKKLLKTTISMSLLCSLGAVQAEAESWYFNFALGYGIPSYPADLKAAAANLKAMGASNTPLSIDLGAYFPMGDGSLIVGPSINGMNDSYTIGSSTLGIIKTGVYFSSMKFFGQEVGDGAFLRGDFGFPRMAVSTSGSVGRDTAGSKYGVGAVLGGGYGHSFATARLLFTATFAYSRVESNNYGTTSFNVGGLF